MTALTTDFIPLNRAGTPGDGSSGNYYVARISDILALADANLSSDAGNLLSAGSDNGAYLPVSVIKTNETTTSLSYVAGTQTLTFTDEDGGVNNIDLSALTSDLKVGSATINGAGQLTFSVVDEDGNPNGDFSVDLSQYINGVTDDQTNGTLTLTSAGGNTVVQKTSWMSATLAP